MDKCKLCGSYAVNPGHHGRPTFDKRVDHDLCDVCFWHTRFHDAKAEIDRLRAVLIEIRDDPILVDFIDPPMRRVINRALSPNA